MLNQTDDDIKYQKDLEEQFKDKFQTTENGFNVFKEEDYVRLQKNLKLYKEGNREATEYILTAFHRVLNMYASFITLHQIAYIEYYDPKANQTKHRINRSLRSFISLFAKTKQQRVKDTCQYIYDLFEKFEYGEIYNQLALALLNMANKYKIIEDKNDPKYKPHGTFHVYVEKCFHFEAFHFLTNMSSDPLVSGFNITELPSDYDNIDDEIEPEKVSQSIKNLIDEKALNDFNLMIDYIDRRTLINNNNRVALRESLDEMDLNSEDALNFNWINGIVCAPIFKCLTSFERELLLLSYGKNQTEEDLARLFHCARASIGKHKRDAIKKLKEYKENHPGL